MHPLPASSALAALHMLLPEHVSSPAKHLEEKKKLERDRGVSGLRHKKRYGHIGRPLRPCGGAPQRQRGSLGWKDGRRRQGEEGDEDGGGTYRRWQG